LPQRIAGSLLRRLVIERRRFDFAPRQMHLQKLVHLLQLELVVREDSKDAFLAIDRAFTALEIEARSDLACHSVQGIVDLGKIDPRNDVEARHSRLIRSVPAWSDIARRPAKTTAAHPAPFPPPSHTTCPLS